MAEKGRTEKGRSAGNLNSLFSRYTGKEKLEGEIDRLNSHISGLELEISGLHKRMDRGAESEKKAVAAKQLAEEAINAAEVRILTLEHELDVRKDAVPPQAGYRLVETLSRRKGLDYLHSLSSLRSPSADLLTAYIPPGISLSGGAYRDMPAGQIDPEAMQLIQKTESSTGCILFYDPGHLVNELVVPPFPVEKAEWRCGESFMVEPLLHLMEREETVLVIVAHAGESLVAYSRDSGEVDSYELVRSNVKSKHSKGGFSQRRFERLREEEIVHHAEKVRTALEEMLGSHQLPDLLLLGGDEQLARMIASGMADDVPRLLSSADISIEKHSIPDLFRQMLVLRRYKL